MIWTALQTEAAASPREIRPSTSAAAPRCRSRRDREDDAEAEMETRVSDAPLDRPPVAQPEQRRRERGADVHARHPADEHVLPGHVFAPIEARHGVLGDVEEPGRCPGEPESCDLPEPLDAPGATSPVHSAVSSPRAARLLTKRPATMTSGALVQALDRFGITAGPSVKKRMCGFWLAPRMPTWCTQHATQNAALRAG